jgi:hypothetical protein
MAKTITSNNATFFLSVPGVFNSPFQVQGFAADDMFSADPQKPVEVVMGVDGNLSGGYVKHQIVMKIKMSPDSPSITYFDQWLAAMDTGLDAYPASGTITMPGNGAVYTLTTGWLTQYKNMPDAKKLLQPQEMEITWQQVTKGSM